jgi:hypothetical protein
MNKVEQIVERLFEDGYDSDEVRDFLSDGESIARMGIDDSDRADVEESFYSLGERK